MILIYNKLMLNKIYLGLNRNDYLVKIAYKFLKIIIILFQQLNSYFIEFLNIPTIETYLQFQDEIN